MFYFGNQLKMTQVCGMWFKIATTIGKTFFFYIFCPFFQRGIIVEQLFISTASSSNVTKLPRELLHIV